MSFQLMALAIDKKCGSAATKMVLLMLANHTNGHTGRCNPSIKRLAIECEMSENSIRNHIARLAELGLLTVIPVIVSGEQRPNQYRLNLVESNIDPTSKFEVPPSEFEPPPSKKRNPPPSKKREGKQEVFNQEEKQEYVEPSVLVSAEAQTRSVCPHVQLITLYHDCLPELNRIMPSRWQGSASATQLQARWREDKRHQSIDFWQRFFETVRTNPHWMGANGWKADLHWLVKRANFDKVITWSLNNNG